MVQREFYCASVIKRAWKSHHFPQKSIDSSQHEVNDKNQGNEHKL